MSTAWTRRPSTYMALRLPLSIPAQRPLANRSSRWAREISECAIRTSARRSRPTTTSLPGANVRVEPSYRTVSAGGVGRLIGTDSIGIAARCPIDAARFTVRWCRERPLEAQVLLTGAGALGVTDWPDDLTKRRNQLRRALRHSYRLVNFSALLRRVARDRKLLRDLLGHAVCQGHGVATRQTGSSDDPGVPA